MGMVRPIEKRRIANGPSVFRFSQTSCGICDILQRPGAEIPWAMVNRLVGSGTGLYAGLIEFMLKEKAKKPSSTLGFTHQQEQSAEH